MDMKNQNNTNQPPPPPSPSLSPPPSFSYKDDDDEDDSQKDGDSWRGSDGVGEREQEDFDPPVQSTPQQPHDTFRQRRKRRKQAEVDASRAAKLYNIRSPVKTRPSKTQVASSTGRKKKSAEAKRAKQKARLSKSYNQSGSGLSQHVKPRWIRLPFD